VLAVGTLYFLLGGSPADTVQMNPAGVPNLPYLASRNLGPVGDGQISWHQVVWCKVQRQAALASGANHASNRECRSPKKWQAFAGMIEYTPRWTDEGSGNSYRAWVGAAAIGEESESALTGSVCTNAGITAAVQYRLTQRFGEMDQCPELDGEVGLEFSLVTTLDDKYPVGTTAWMIHRNLQRVGRIDCCGWTRPPAIPTQVPGFSHLLVTAPLIMCTVLYCSVHLWWVDLGAGVVCRLQPVCSVGPRLAVHPWVSLQ
jgi:hypothetical protein